MKRAVAVSMLVAIFTGTLAWSQSLEVGIGVGSAVLKSATLYTDPIFEGGYGFGPADPSVQAIVKYRLRSKRMSIIAGISYVPLSSSATPVYLVEDFRYPGYGALSKTEYHASMTSIMMGVEWFLRKEGSGPYLGSHVQLLCLSSIKSEKRFALGIVNERIDGWTLIDAGIHVGFEIPLAAAFVLDLGGHYNLGWMTELYDGSRGLNAFGADARILCRL